MHKSLKALLLFFAVLTISLAAAGLHKQTPGTPPNGGQEAVDESQFPIAEETAPEPSTPAERTRRNNKEKKYKKYKDYIGHGVTVASAHYHWPPGFPTLPVTQSDAVVMGEVSDARAYLTVDKDTVYSEFTVRISEVLKDDNQSPLSQGGSIVAERPGGRVRYSSGHVGRFSMTGWGMPRVGRRYVLFLNRNDQEADYRIVTGYELRSGRVFPLDATTSSETDFDAYINMDKASFLSRLHTAIANSSSTRPQ